MHRIVLGILFIVLFLSVSGTQAAAHVVVTPGEVGVAERKNFVVSVPTESEFPTTMIRLVVPESLQSVRPNVKPGWNIELVKTGDGENPRVSEIIWSGGSIPAEQRDEFVFSAQAPSEPTELVWKAYQTYGDGTVVAWDTDPETVKSHESGGIGHTGDSPKPYSVTQVINDLVSTNKTDGEKQQGVIEDKLLYIAVFAALIMSAGSLYLQFRKK